MQGNSRIFALFVAGESALGILAVLLSWWAEIPLRTQLRWEAAGAYRGLAACAAMVVAFLISRHIPWKPLAELGRQMDGLIREIFRTSSWPELAIISAAAGIGEELLFRGVLQPWIGMYSSPLVGLAIASLLFGAVHAMSTTYFIAATLLGVFLGWMTMTYDDLIGPIVAHALYDFVAIMLIRSSLDSPTTQN